jgi:hypothetical protein
MSKGATISPIRKAVWAQGLTFSYACSNQSHPYPSVGDNLYNHEGAWTIGFEDVLRGLAREKPKLPWALPVN